MDQIIMAMCCLIIPGLLIMYILGNEGVRKGQKANYRASVRKYKRK